MSFTVKSEDTPNEKVIQLRINSKDWDEIKNLESDSGTSWQSIIRQMIKHCLAKRKSEVTK